MGYQADKEETAHVNEVTWHGRTTRNKATLITVALRCFGKDITAVIDSGSQLNIIRRDVYLAHVPLPMLPDKVVKIKDANGNDGYLSGLVKQVPLMSGEVVTYSNLFIGERSVPYEMILGRPWARDNLVSIDECKIGTYLLFNGEDGRKYELCAVLENMELPPKAEEALGGPTEDKWKLYEEMQRFGVALVAEANEEEDSEKEELTVAEFEADMDFTTEDRHGRNKRTVLKRLKALNFPTNKLVRTNGRPLTPEMRRIWSKMKNKAMQKCSIPERETVIEFRDVWMPELPVKLTNWLTDVDSRTWLSMSDEIRGSLLAVKVVVRPTTHGREMAKVRFNKRAVEFEQWIEEISETQNVGIVMTATEEVLEGKSFTATAQNEPIPGHDAMIVIDYKGSKLNAKIDLEAEYNLLPRNSKIWDDLVREIMTNEDVGVDEGPFIYHNMVTVTYKGINVCTEFYTKVGWKDITLGKPWLEGYTRATQGEPEASGTIFMLTQETMGTLEDEVKEETTERISDLGGYPRGTSSEINPPQIVILIPRSPPPQVRIFQSAQDNIYVEWTHWEKHEYNWQYPDKDDKQGVQVKEIFSDSCIPDYRMNPESSITIGYADRRQFTRIVVDEEEYGIEEYRATWVTGILLVYTADGMTVFPESERVRAPTAEWQILKELTPQTSGKVHMFINETLKELEFEEITSRYQPFRVLVGREADQELTKSRRRKKLKSTRPPIIYILWVKSIRPMSYELPGIKSGSKASNKDLVLASRTGIIYQEKSNKLSVLHGLDTLYTGTLDAEEIEVRSRYLSPENEAFGIWMTQENIDRLHNWDYVNPLNQLKLSLGSVNVQGTLTRKSMEFLPSGLPLYRMPEYEDWEIFPYLSLAAKWTQSAARHMRQKTIRELGPWVEKFCYNCQAKELQMHFGKPKEAASMAIFWNNNDTTLLVDNGHSVKRYPEKADVKIPRDDWYRLRMWREGQTIPVEVETNGKTRIMDFAKVESKEKVPFILLKGTPSILQSEGWTTIYDGPNNGWESYEGEVGVSDLLDWTNGLPVDLGCNIRQVYLRQESEYDDEEPVTLAMMHEEKSTKRQVNYKDPLMTDLYQIFLIEAKLSNESEIQQGWLKDELNEQLTKAKDMSNQAAKWLRKEKRKLLQDWYCKTDKVNIENEMTLDNVTKLKSEVREVSYRLKNQFNCLENMKREADLLAQVLKDPEEWNLQSGPLPTPVLTRNDRKNKYRKREAADPQEDKEVELMENEWEDFGWRRGTRASRNSQNRQRRNGKSLYISTKDSKKQNLPKKGMPKTEQGLSRKRVR